MIRGILMPASCFRQLLEVGLIKFVTNRQIWTLVLKIASMGNFIILTKLDLLSDTAL